MTALGLIETKGFLAAVEGADAMLKAADVCLLEKNIVRGGFVTITVGGEVSAVRASVDAAVAAIRRIETVNGIHGVLLSEHVIARPDMELTQILVLEPTNEPRETETSKNEVPETQNNILETECPHVNAASERPDPAEVTPGEVRHDIKQLKTMNVNKLRQIAQNVRGLSMPQGKIASADKKSLIEAIINAYRQIEE